MKKFEKLDLVQAYQWLLLDETFCEYSKINTHKRLFRSTRLQFGVYSAAGIFQREMKRRLSNISFTVVRMDDVLISGEYSCEHMKNLVAVLKVLKACGLRLKEEKSEFISDEVTYLGLIINMVFHRIRKRFAIY